MTFLRTNPDRPRRSAIKPLIVIFTAIGLDAVGIGLIFPILPRLLKERDTHQQRRALHRHHDRALRGDPRLLLHPSSVH